jgi:hypothetical protein
MIPPPPKRNEPNFLRSQILVGTLATAAVVAIGVALFALNAVL